LPHVHFSGVFLPDRRSDIASPPPPLQMAASAPLFPHASDEAAHRQQQLTAALLLAAFIVALRLLNFSDRARALLAPSIRFVMVTLLPHPFASHACSRMVVSGTKFVQGQQIMRCKLLDIVFNAMSISVGVEFYITFLPFLFWIDQVCGLCSRHSNLRHQPDALADAARTPLHSAHGHRRVTLPRTASLFDPRALLTMQSSCLHASPPTIQLHRQLPQGRHVHRSSTGLVQGRDTHV
jgi:hypothetical protein